MTREKDKRLPGRAGGGPDAARLVWRGAYKVPQVDIIISNSSGKPIYEQIADQVKEQIMAGALAAGDALPSMRLLAKELRISVITTKRAYEELERDGLVYSQRTAGRFVTEDHAASKDTDRLFSMLPYKTLSFSKIEGRHEHTP